jgi:hypothetical protein
MGLASRLTLNVVADYIRALDLADTRSPLNKTYTVSFADGVAAGQANVVFHDRRTLGPSANEDLDLIGTMLSDPAGVALSMIRVKALIISAAQANANNVVVGAAAATPWATLLNSTGTVTVRPGATLAYFASALDAVGHVAAAGASDLLRVTNGGAGTSVDYDIMLIGANA